MAALHGQVVAGNFLPALGVHQAAVGVFHLPEVLPGVVVHAEDHGRDLGGQPGQVHGDGLVVAVTRAGAVVAAVAHGAVLALQLAEPHRVHELPGRVEHQRVGVQVHVLLAAAEAKEPLFLDGVPAQAHLHGAEARPGFLGE